MQETFFFMEVELSYYPVCSSVRRWFFGWYVGLSGGGWSVINLHFHATINPRKEIIVLDNVYSHIIL